MVVVVSHLLVSAEFVVTGATLRNVFRYRPGARKSPNKAVGRTNFDWKLYFGWRRTYRIMDNVTISFAINARLFRAISRGGVMKIKEVAKYFEPRECTWVLGCSASSVSVRPRN